MRFLGWNLLLATWLLISAFVFAQPPLSLAQTTVTAVLVLVFAYLAPARPGLRYVITLLSVLLALSALLMPGVHGPAAINNAIMAALLFGLSSVKPGLAPRTGPGPEGEALGAPPPAAGAGAHPRA